MGRGAAAFISSLVQTGIQQRVRHPYLGRRSQQGTERNSKRGTNREVGTRPSAKWALNGREGPGKACAAPGRR